VSVPRLSVSSESERQYCVSSKALSVSVSQSEQQLVCPSVSSDALTVDALTKALTVTGSSNTLTVSPKAPNISVSQSDHESESPSVGLNDRLQHFKIMTVSRG
jgi:hypothetical protein